MAPAARVVAHADGGAAAAAAARDIADHLREAVRQRGRAHVAFSGGSTAPPLLRALAAEALPWAQIHVYQVDERVAPDGDADRNAGALQEVLLDAAPIPPANVHLMPVTADDLDAAAADYGDALPRLDVAHMGLGDDGHTASWPPGDPVVDEQRRPVVIVGPFNGRLRMTVTPPVVDAAREVVFLLYGASKREPLGRMLDGDRSVPAARVPAAHTVVHCDVDAYPEGRSSAEG
jgi:6-phosphogluconolactonase